METESERKNNGRNSQPAADKAFRTKDVAHILDCSPDDVIEFCKRGELQAFKQGRFWRITPSAVKKYQRKIDAEGKTLLADEAGKVARKV